MANLKQDLKNELNNQKYYKEQQLSRLYADTTTDYEVLVIKVLDVLEDIVLIDAKAQMVEFYFKEQTSVQQNPGNGQSHQE
jgi:hypothetical protein